MENIAIYYGNKSTSKKWFFPKFFILQISPIMKRILEENKDIIINAEQFKEKDIEYLFNNFLLYPFLEPSYHKTFNELKENLCLENINEIIRFYQIKNSLYLIHDLLNNTKIEDLKLENFKIYFELRQFFKIDKLHLHFFNLDINNFLIKNIFDKKLFLDNLDDDTKAFLINLILSKVKKKQYFGYIIEIDSDL